MAARISRLRGQVCGMIGSMTLGTTLPDEGGPEEVPRSLLLAFAPLHKAGLGAACAFVCGLLVFFVTAFLIVTHSGGPLGPHLGLLSQFFLGYSVTWEGALVGLLWGSALGFVVGWMFAFVRNLVLALYLILIRARADVDEYRDFLDHI